MSNIILAGVLAAVISYLLGSVSFSILFTKLFDHQKDIRSMGSGNAGATNVLRSVGVKAAVCTFVFDFAKGVLSVFLGKLLFQYLAVPSAAGMVSEFELIQFGAYLSGFFCVMGHIYPLYFGFKGGKGVLTSWAIIALIDWRSFILVIVVFIVVFLISKIVSLSSICAAASYPICTLIFNLGIAYCWKHEVTLFYVILTFVIGSLQAGILIWKHRSNIQRIRQGTEKKITIKKKS